MTTDSAPVVLPTPASMTVLNGSFTLSEHTAVQAPPDFADAIDLLRRSIFAATGFRLPTADDADIVLCADSALGVEEYRLTVARDGIKLCAGGTAGARYGVQTLRQLMPVDCFGSGPARGDTIQVRSAQIADWPRFTWRGLHLDVARHFFDVQVVLRLLDVMALHKFNVLHLHLTDDQGWRFPVPGYPRLTQVGSRRAGTQRGHDADKCSHDGIAYGGYYSRSDLETIVRQADRLGITIVPEVDMPGHMRAAIAAYPEFGNTGIPLEVDTHWGVSDHVLNFADHTVDFCRAVLDEVLDIFPGPYVHIGGDEVPSVQWQHSAQAHQQAKVWQVDGVPGLQRRFFELMAAHLQAHGRQVIGWDEVVDAGAPREIVVMGWRGLAAGARAAKAGHRVVLTPAPILYFDYLQGAEDLEPIGMAGEVTVQDVLAYQPTISADQQVQQQVLGVQGQLWTEYIRTEHHLQYMAFPRACALAEVAWCAPERRDNAHFMAQLPTHLQRLDRLGVNYRRP